MEKLIIEAAISEAADKVRNPRVPYSPQEIAEEALEAADAGAAIVHFHARDPETGAFRYPGTELYTESMSLIRRHNKDVILYPAYGHFPEPKDSFQHIEALAEHPDIKLDCATIDPGAVNLGEFDEQDQRYVTDRVLSVTHREVEYFLSLCNRLDIRYSICVRELGHVRHAITYYRKGLVKRPLFFKLFLSDYHNWGMAPSANAIITYMHRMMPPDIPYRWMACVYGSSHSPMNSVAISMGGHVRTGIGDNPVLDGEMLTNAEQVERVVIAARAIGREVATPSEARAILDRPPTA